MISYLIGILRNPSGYLHSSAAEVILEEQFDRLATTLLKTEL